MMRLPLPWLLCLTGGALALLLVGSWRPAPWPSFGESLRALFAGQGSGIEAHKLLIVQEIRLPRTLLCIAVGDSRPLRRRNAGAVSQPLADPGIIGVSGGAALGAALAIVLLAPRSAVAEPARHRPAAPARLSRRSPDHHPGLSARHPGGAPRSPSCCWPGWPSPRCPVP